jgi:Fe-S oxidoreductase
MIKHLRPRRIWDYLNGKAELMREERQHLAKCVTCLQMLRICISGEPPENSIKEPDDSKDERRSA